MRFPEGKKVAQFNIPNSVKSIMECAFFNCNSLQKVVLPDGMKKIDYEAFDECISLQNIEIPSSVTEIEAWAFNNNVNLKNIVLPKGLKKISMGAFRGCNKLMILTIPKNVSEVGDFAYGYRYVEEDGYYPGDPSLRYPNAKIKCYTNTAGHKYAKDNGIPYELLDGTSQTVNTSKDSEVKVSGIKISGISKKIAAGKKIKLTAKVSPSKATNKSVKWTSGNKKVATVNSKGVVTVNKKAGGKSVTITAAATDGSKKKATYKISVMKGVVKKVAISGNKSVKAGKTLKLKAKVTATKKANKTLKWTSSNKKYATVNSSGKVKTYKAGKGKKVKITAEATDGSGKKKTVTIKIK